MSVETINSDFWTKRTNQIIRNLQEDEMLCEGLDGHSVGIYKGFPRLGMEKLAIYVYRASDDSDEYAMGGGMVTIEATWQIVCLIRHAGAPAELEDLIATLSANVHRNLWAHMGAQLSPEGDTLWEVARTGAATAAEVRDETDQHYDIETIPLSLKFQLMLS